MNRTNLKKLAQSLGILAGVFLITMAAVYGGFAFGLGFNMAPDKIRMAVTDGRSWGIVATLIALPAALIERRAFRLAWLALIAAAEVALFLIYALYSGIDG